MQFPESWLRSLTNPAISTDELAHQLTMAGLEVEETAPVAPAFSGVVVAQVLAVEPHPNADKLRVCKVDAGQGEALQIVCGAPNVAAGMKVPLATVGAKLPGGIKIGVAKMRGVESAGMLCSARELGLSQDHAGLLDLVKTGTAPGAPDVNNAAYADFNSNFLVPKMIQRVVIDGKTTEEAIDEAQKQGEAIYAKYA